MEIRRAESDADLTGYAQVWNAITPSEPITVAETKRRLARQPWRLYLVAEDAGRIVGSGFPGRTDSADRAFLAACCPSGAGEESELPSTRFAARTLSSSAPR
jgi:hypothetical protein